MERIAEVIESLDNLIAATNMNMPAEIHLEALRVELPELRDRLYEAFVNLGGEDYLG